MAARVFLHIGLPKTATTYLQTIMWSHRDVLAEQQVLLPGRDRRDHLWASRILRGDKRYADAGTRRGSAWDRLVEETGRWTGDVVISHEFFAAASPEQAARTVQDLAPAEVHLVVTAREPLGLFTASWQESVKNRDTRRMEAYSRTVSPSPASIWNWRTLDVRLVLERWAPAFPPERVHVLPLPPPSAPRREIWDRYARLIGVDPDSVDLTQSFPNASMGVVEAETLRRLNRHLKDFQTSIDRGTYIRTFLADERLVPRGGEPFWPEPARIEEARVRGRDAVAHIAEHGYDVIGELSSLLVPDELPERRTPESVTDAEVAQVAVELVARMLHDVRDLRQERRDLRSRLRVQTWRAANPTLRAAVVKRFPRLAGRVQVPPPLNPPADWSPE